MELLQVKDFTYYYPRRRESPALDSLHFSVRQGEFILLAGPSGCGKSSLLKALSGLLPDYYGGSMRGDIFYRGRSLKGYPKRSLAREAGIVFQDPEKQSVMSAVEQEIAFGLENLGLGRDEMKRRVSEILSLFGLSKLRRAPLAELSGGEKQKVALAAVLVMQPKLLLLDEPTSQLDPVTAREFLDFVFNLNREWGLTVMLVEQRVERCFHLSDRVILMDGGRIAADDTPRELVRTQGEKYADFIPPVTRVFLPGYKERAPLTIREGQTLLEDLIPGRLGDDSPVRNTDAESVTFSGNQPRGCPAKSVPGNASGKAPPAREQALLEIRRLQFFYPGTENGLQKIDLAIYPASITVLLGENGAGKTTLLKNINGLLKGRKGRFILRGEDITATGAEERAAHIGYLSQHPEDYLFNDTVAGELAFGLEARGLDPAERVPAVLDFLLLQGVKDQHPRDLSGGEKQRVALGTVLAADPAILLMDEPTRGMDSSLKRRLAETLKALKSRDKGIIVVTHDIEFAAFIADRVAVLSGGEIVASGSREEILSSSFFYSTQVNRVFNRYCPGILTVQEGRRFLQHLEKEVI